MPAFLCFHCFSLLCTGSFPRRAKDTGPSHVQSCRPQRKSTACLSAVTSVIPAVPLWGSDLLVPDSPLLLCILYDSDIPISYFTSYQITCKIIRALLGGDRWQSHLYVSLSDASSFMRLCNRNFDLIILVVTLLRDRLSSTYSSFSYLSWPLGEILQEKRPLCY